MKAYSTLRPISLGTYPKEYECSIVNFDNRIWCDEIKCEAWGYIEFAEDVPEDILSRYDLTAVPKIDPQFERITKAIAKQIQRGIDESRITKLIAKAVSYGYTEDSVRAGIDTALAV